MNSTCLRCSLHDVDIKVLICVCVCMREALLAVDGFVSSRSRHAMGIMNMHKISPAFKEVVVRLNGAAECR